MLETYRYTDVFVVDITIHIFLRIHLKCLKLIKNYRKTNHSTHLLWRMKNCEWFSQYRIVTYSFKGLKKFQSPYLYRAYIL